jgi:hypothetical protein
MLDSSGEGRQYIPAVTLESASPSCRHQAAQFALWRASGVGEQWVGRGASERDKGFWAACERDAAARARGMVLNFLV